MDSSYFDKELCIWGASWDLKQNLIYSKLKRFLNIENKINCSGYNLSEKDIIEIYKLLNKTNPKIIKSYPSILTTICDIFNKHNISYEPEVIHIGGEKLYDYQREKLKKHLILKFLIFTQLGTCPILPKIVINLMDFIYLWKTLFLRL